MVKNPLEDVKILQNQCVTGAIGYKNSRMVGDSTPHGTQLKKTQKSHNQTSELQTGLHDFT
jgi:hypothetical protein